MTAIVADPVCGSDGRRSSSDTMARGGRMPDPATQFRKVQATHAGARQQDVGSFQTLTPQLTALANALRETYQSSVATPVMTVNMKLKAGGPLSPDDIKVVEGFMIGDAEAYTRVENDLQNWIGELARLVKSLSEKADRLQGPAILDAMGEVADAQRVLGDICNFL